MGNAKSRNNKSTKIEKEISRNLTQSSKVTTARTIYRKEDNSIKVGGTTTTTTTAITAATTVGGPLFVEVRNTATKTTTVDSNKALKDRSPTKTTTTTL